jgi:hypothetical protein
MEHDDAVSSHAAERYAARELSPAERSDFEEHYFECPECAEAVRFELTFAANVRAAYRDQSAETLPLPASTPPSAFKKASRWLLWRPALPLALATNFVLAAGVVFLLSTGRQTTRPQLAPAYFAPAAARGADDVHVLSPADSFYLVRFPGVNGGNYSYEILDAAGKRESSGSLQAPAGDTEFLFLPVPVRRLPAGLHTLVVRGGAADSIVSRSRFQTAR